MKLIEAMKKLKDLGIKADDLRKKVSQHCAALSFETPVYGEKQRETVMGWIQSHTDIMQEIARLRVAIQKTNIATLVDIDLGGKKVTKSIAEWIHRRRDLAKLDLDMWSKLTDRGLKEGSLAASQAGGTATEVKIVRYFDPGERDAKMELYRSEPMVIDATLEVVNAVTDLIEG